MFRLEHVLELLVCHYGKKHVYGLQYKFSFDGVLRRSHVQIMKNHNHTFYLLI